MSAFKEKKRKLGKDLMKTAFFSILAPGKHIPEHRGLYKGFIRYHLGWNNPYFKKIVAHISGCSYREYKVIPKRK